MISSAALLLADGAPSASTSGPPFWAVQFGIPLVTALLTLVGIWYQSRRKRIGPIKEIDQAIEIHNALPDKSVSREKLVAHIDNLVVERFLERSTHRRDGAGMSVAVIFVALGSWLAYLADDGGWAGALWVPSVILVILGVFGFFFSLEKAERDTAGKKIKKVDAEAG